MALAQMVAQTSWLPHPDTVSTLECAVFPTARARKQHPRFTHILRNGTPVGMYDDNATPAWTLLWSHGIIGGNRKGWSFAHIWPVSDDIESYTHLANLAMIPECFAGMTDKNGPLTGYLRWHAWILYGWKPNKETPTEKPSDYDLIKWRYLPKINDPRLFIREQILRLKNQRVRILRPLMEEQGSR